MKFWNNLISFVMLAFEFHVWRLVFLTVFISAVYQVSTLHLLIYLSRYLDLETAKGTFSVLRVKLPPVITFLTTQR